MTYNAVKEVISMCEQGKEENIIPQVLAEQAVGQLVLKWMSQETREQVIYHLGCNRAVHVLEEIRQVLENMDIDDPACFCRIEEIVGIFFDHGLPTQRHEEFE
ncbi:MAG: hypothetical protein KH704_03515 [Clostridiales bacterium]|nr:hypothetical protein [Clostridiales bacterium]